MQKKRVVHGHGVVLHRPQPRAAIAVAKMLLKYDPKTGKPITKK